MLKIKYISMKNFFSFGNIPQVVHLDRTALALILGHNKDAAVTDGSHGHRNGVGKSAIIQGIVYGLYGKSIDNSIKIPNLVNKINEKNCAVELVFEQDGKSYRIERGRSPTYFNFYHLDSDGNVIVDDDTRGETKDTQEELNSILGISQKLFEHIVVLNANVDPFLSLPQQRQRDMIEELLGITQLTEKATILKDMAKESKRLADQEQFKNDTILESNKRIESTIEKLQQSVLEFEASKASKIQSINEELMSYIGLDFSAMKIEADARAEIISNNNTYNATVQTLATLENKCKTYDAKIQSDKDKIRKDIESLENINIEEELQHHKDHEDWLELKTILAQAQSNHMLYTQQLKTVQSTIASLETTIESENGKKTEVLNSKCPTCKSILEHNEHSTALLNKIEADIVASQTKLDDAKEKLVKVQELLGGIELFELPPEPKTIYRTLSEATLHEHKLNDLRTQLVSDTINIYSDDLKECAELLSTLELKDVPDCLSNEDVNMLEFRYKSLCTDLEREQGAINPYTSQIEVLKSDSIQEICYDDYNHYSKLNSHQDFLSKLLLSKDSFVRKRVIEQNLTYLNSRLQYYIERTGSLHTVIFMNDLSVDITLNSQSYDFSQLSRGERTRIIIALNLAFRDTYESLYQKIDIMFIDELFDQGLDTTGIIDSWKILQDMSTTQGKSIYVVSHRDELIEKADTIVKVQKEHNFSTISFTSADDLTF